MISNFNLTISDSAVPNHIRPGLVGWPCPDEKRHIWARQGGRGGQEWAAGCGGVFEKPSEVHGLGRKTAERSDKPPPACAWHESVIVLWLWGPCIVFTFSPRRFAGWPTRNWKDAACQSCCRRGRRAVLLRLWIGVWRNVCWSGCQPHQEPFQWVFKQFHEYYHSIRFCFPILSLQVYWVKLAGFSQKNQ